MPNLYATLDDLKHQVGIRPDDATVNASVEAMLLAKLAAASRQVDLCTRHQFFVTVGTRRFTAEKSDHLILKHADLLAVTSLDTDTSGDRTYGSSWAAEEYDLGPEEAPYDSPPAPYWRIDRAPGSAGGFPCGVRLGVQITGRWGYYDVRQREISVVRDDENAIETVLSVTNGAEFTTGQTILVGAEQMHVEGIAGNNLSVVRAVNGTTATGHDKDTPIDLYVYPVVHEACLLQAARLWQRQDSPVGWTGSNEVGVARVWSQLDPDARILLSPLRAVGIF